MSLADPKNAHDAAKAVPLRDYTLTFYVDSIKPKSLPMFPYIVNGSIAGRVRMVAYVAAEDPTQAQYKLADAFDEAYVESIDQGRMDPAPPSFHGVSQPEKRPGFFRRMLAL